jgi:hypothetical protein
MDVVRKSHLRHSHADTEGCQKALLSLAAPTARSQKVASLAKLATMTRSSAPMTKDLVLFGGISTVTPLLLSEHEELVIGALALISHICDLSVTCHAAACFVDANVLENIGSLLSSSSPQVRTLAASTTQRLITSFGRALVKDFGKVLGICKSLVDIIQLDSWNSETAASAALWAVVDLQYGEGDISAALAHWRDRYIVGEAADSADNVAAEGMDVEDLSSDDVDMDMDTPPQSPAKRFSNLSRVLQLSQIGPADIVGLGQVIHEGGLQISLDAAMGLYGENHMLASKTEMGIRSLLSPHTLLV